MHVYLHTQAVYIYRERERGWGGGRQEKREEVGFGVCITLHYISKNKYKQ